jgi:hypothetical protein
MSLGTLPAWGMTRGGELFELPTPERRISEPGFSSLLRTPLQDDGSNANPSPSRRETLASLAFLSTPVVNDMGSGKDPQAWDEWAARQMSLDGRPAPHGKSLEQEALRLLPTPTVMDMGANYTPEEWQAWKAKQQAAHQNGNGHGASLTQEAISLLPTPNCMDAIGERSDEALARAKLKGGCSNLKDVLPRIGASTPPLSTAGSLSSDDPLLLPLFPAPTAGHA